MNYQLIAECIKSGQVSAEQIAEHMKDEVFAKWYEKNRIAYGR